MDPRMRHGNGQKPTTHKGRKRGTSASRRKANTPKSAQSRAESFSGTNSRYLSSTFSLLSTSGCENYDFNIFPFQNLPVDCKLKVFSFLTLIEKGNASFVCKEWYRLMKTPCLYSTINFSEFSLCSLPLPDHSCNNDCYQIYKTRIHKFFDFLIKIRPVIRRLEFKFDIIEQDGGYLLKLQDLLQSAQLYDLRYVYLNWKETPVKPFWHDETGHSVARDWSQGNEEIFRKRHRGRYFVYFFDEFTKITPNISTLVLPFHWSERSVRCLSRLQNLDSLVIEKYFVFQALEQQLLDNLLNNLWKLRRLLLEVWTPSGYNFIMYTLRSDSLEYLDISQSRGFYLNGLIMPKLKCFRVSRQPWNGPLVIADRLQIPCLYEILVQGVPCLEKINDHYLESHWKEIVYDKLEEVLRAVCSCRRHKRGWAM